MFGDIMKGQIFIAGAAFLVVLLVLIRGSFNVPVVNDVSSMSAQLDNIAAEYRYATGFSFADKSDRLEELSDYFGKEVNGFDAIYALISAEPGAYTFRLGNFLRDNAAVTVTAENSDPSAVSAPLADKQVVNWNFNTVSGNDIRLRIEYVVQNRRYEQSLNLSADRNRTLSWFDVGIRTDDETLRRSGVFDVTGG